MIKQTLLLIISVFLLPISSTQAVADVETTMEQASTVGKAGWDLGYGYDEDLDGPLNENKEDEEPIVTAPHGDDFFGEEVESYDQVLSDEHKKKVKPYEPVIMP